VQAEHEAIVGGFRPKVHVNTIGTPPTEAHVTNGLTSQA